MKEHRPRDRGILNFRESLHLIEKEFDEPMPGLMAQLAMVPNPRPGHKVYLEVEDTCIKAGILILLYPRKDRLCVLLTRRTDQVKFHQAQISFPGGRQEPKETFKQTALREAQEELAISPQSVRILGELTPLFIPPSNYCIYPIVAVSDERPDFSPFKKEVAEVIEVPLDHLLDPQNTKEEQWVIRGEKVNVPFYFYKGHKIWGATAMVLAEFLELVKRSF